MVPSNNRSPIDRRVAIVTGGNRGLGFETCRMLAKRDHHVVLTSRSEKEGQAAAEALRNEGLPVSFHRLDVTSEAHANELARWMGSEFGRVDVLINNAGINDYDRFEGLRAADTTVDEVRQYFETNTIGPFLLCRSIVPLMKVHKYGRVVNVSSWLGQLSQIEAPGFVPYRFSKAALNSLTCIIAAENMGENILVNSVCPGWLKTKMGGRDATTDVEVGADGVVWAATLPDGGLTGCFFRDRQLISW